MKWFHIIAFLLVIIGGLNWGLVGLLNINLVMWLLGAGMITKAVYILVGLSAIYLVATHKGDCKTCGMKKKK